ncbi:MAG: hypothetical protein ACYDAR_09375 [Thermomicrobiales bacterium]
MTLHNRRAPHTAISVAPPVVTSAQRRFLENNTTTLPNAVTVEIQPTVISREQQLSLEANTTTLPSVGAANVTVPVVPREQQRFLEVNTILPWAATMPYMEDLTPANGRPR